MANDKSNNIPEPLMKILESMSLIYEICLKKDQYNIKVDSDLYKQVLKTYNDMQILRDDSTFTPIEIDLNDMHIKQQKLNRIKELSAPPFNAIKDTWMK